MNYNNILELLIVQFPELEKELNENSYLQDFPHCVCDIVLVPYIVNSCKEERSRILNKIGEFLEQMAECADINVKELLSVSILEPLVLEENVIQILNKYLKKETLKEVKYWQTRYDRF